ncbi:hypothetical protein L2E82_51963 [Cichorium intybus]|nr:hypothetical protein L2E82_51963 [Cichorium intybus]
MRRSTRDREDIREVRSSVRFYGVSPVRKVWKNKVIPVMNCESDGSYRENGLRSGGVGGALSGGRNGVIRRSKGSRVGTLGNCSALLVPADSFLSGEVDENLGWWVNGRRPCSVPAGSWHQWSLIRMGCTLCALGGLVAGNVVTVAALPEKG